MLICPQISCAASMRILRSRQGEHPNLMTSVNSCCVIEHTHTHKHQYYSNACLTLIRHPRTYAGESPKRQNAELTPRRSPRLNPMKPDSPRNFSGGYQKNAGRKEKNSRVPAAVVQLVAAPTDEVARNMMRTWKTP